MLLETYASAMNELIVDGLDVRIATANLEFIERSNADGMDILTFRRTGDAPQLSLEVPVANADGFWHPNANGQRFLPPDWAGEERTSLISSSPLGVLYDPDGDTLLGFAFDAQTTEATIRFGVSEEWKAFVVHFELHTDAAPDLLKLALVDGSPRFSSAITVLKDWLATRFNETPMPRSSVSLQPVYSTWYAYSQDINAEKIERDAMIASQIGCGAVFIDDGWQRFGDGRWYQGCGDWQPDLHKFPNLAEHISRLHALDLSVILWVAPLLLGEQSDVFKEYSQFAPAYSERLRGNILDPRHPQVRQFIVSTCMRLIVDYRLDGLKIDFLDEAMAYAQTPSTGDLSDVGVAMRIVLADLRAALGAAGLEDILIEFRQTYVGPATAAYGNVLRANDCPADAALNRRSIADVRLLATTQVTHADPMMWDHRDGAEGAVRQLLNGYFAVPQVSMRLHELPETHLRAVSWVLSQWKRTRDVALLSTFDAGLPTQGVPYLVASNGLNAVMGVYQEHIVTLPDASHITILNGSSRNAIAIRIDRPQKVSLVERRLENDIVERMELTLTEGINELPIRSGSIAELHVED